MTISHHRALELIQADLNGALSRRDRAALEEHLSGCARCRAEMTRMAHLDSELDVSLRRRWPRRGASPARLNRVIETVEAGAGRGFALRWLGLDWLGSAGQYAAIALVMGVLALALGSVSGGGSFLAGPAAEPPTAEVSATPTATETGTPEPSAEATGTATLTPVPASDTPLPTETLPPTLTPTPTLPEATAALGPADTPTPGTPAATEPPGDTPAPSPSDQPQAGVVTVGCSQMSISGAAVMAAPFMRVTVNLASNLFVQLGAEVVPVGADGGFSATLTYSATQPEGTRLIVAFGEWDGSQFLRPATLNGYDCSG